METETKPTEPTAEELRILWRHYNNSIYSLACVKVKKLTAGQLLAHMRELETEIAAREKVIEMMDGRKIRPLPGSDLKRPNCGVMRPGAPFKVAPFDDFF